MYRYISFIILLLLVSCEPLVISDKFTYKDNDKVKEITIKGVSFMMVKVEGGTFMMGDDDADRPRHKVILPTYYVGETEVTQALWEAVMGSNPSRYKAKNYPVECVSWDDCQLFIQKLKQLTGLQFSLPTEAQWEFAAIGGNQSKGYLYSGSNTSRDVARYGYPGCSGSQMVGEKLPNELGLYDMSGNVWEFCQDWFDYNYYNNSPLYNPTGPVSGDSHVSRGGGWNNSEESCLVSNRFYGDYPHHDQGLRLVLSTNTYDEQSRVTITDYTTYKQISVDNVIFNMIKVDGGTFAMGAIESDTLAYSGEILHKVILSNYYIGEMEVTQALWETLMDYNPSEIKGSLLPVENLYWNDCQIFITKLNNLTGLHFSLPTEAQWEYAAKGGCKSKGFLYSGSNSIDEVAWYTLNSNSTTHVVGSKKANELGLYDMSGNVWEWCQDWYDSNYYNNSPISNPTGPYNGTSKIRRGGSYLTHFSSCRNSNRSSYNPSEAYKIIGFRIVLE